MEPCRVRHIHAARVGLLGQVGRSKRGGDGNIFLFEANHAGRHVTKKRVAICCSAFLISIRLVGT